VIFYALMGDHPQAGPRKLRLGIPGTTTTLEVLRDLLCQTHNIDPLKARLDIQYFATREAVPPSTILRNYDELRVTCTRRQLRDVVEEEERVEAARRRVQEQEAEQRVFSMLGETTSAASYVSTSIPLRTSAAAAAGSTYLMKIAAISKLVLPLRLPPLSLEATGDADPAGCVLCASGLLESEAAVTACCHRKSCKTCLVYAQSLVVEGQCPVCGSASPSSSPLHTDATANATSAVKRENASSHDAAVSVQPSVAAAFNSQRRHWSALLRADRSCGDWLDGLQKQIGCNLQTLVDTVIAAQDGVQKETHPQRREKRPRSSSSATSDNDDLFEW
jgi:hypothetical protein